MGGQSKKIRESRNRGSTHTRIQGGAWQQFLRCPVSLLLSYACVLLHVVVVGATPAVESPGSCRDGAGSIPAARVASVPKRRLQAPGCSECAPPAAGLQDPQAARAARGGGGVSFSLYGVGGRGLLEKEAKVARRTYRGRQSRCRACCCRGRWCVYDDRRDRTSAVVSRVYVSDLRTSPSLLPYSACRRHKHAHALTPIDL